MSFETDFNLPGNPYLLSHSVGLLSKRGAATLEDAYIAPWKSRGGDAWPVWLQIIDDFRAELAKLLGGDASCFCPQPNLSAAFVKYLLSLPSLGRAHCVLMHRDAFPSMGFAVEALRDFGVTLEFLPAGSDPCAMETWVSALEPHHDIVLITHVHSNTGAVSPVADIIDVCRKRNVRSVVDVAQSAGILPIDLKNWSANMVMGSCVKWLCGGPGAGFIWVNETDLGALKPRDVGWFSHEDPFEFDITSFRYAEDAMRFWGGTPSIAPYAAALGGLQTLNEIGETVIWEHNRALLNAALEALPGCITAGIDLGKNGGTLCLSCPPGDIAGLIEALQEERIQVDCRASTMRASFHIYNTDCDVAHLAQTVCELLP